MARGASAICGRFRVVEAGHQLIGVEFAKETLKLARKSPCAEQVRWIEGGVVFCQKSFNKIVAQLAALGTDLAIMTGHVAQFFLDDGDWQMVLSSIYNALRPGGYVAFESRNPNVEPFADWPTKAAPCQLQDPIAGDIARWHEMIDVRLGDVKYENSLSLCLG